MKCKRFIRNIKAISPIFATLILIAIAVIAGVVVYMFTSGTLATMTNGGAALTEKVTIQGTSLNATAATVSVYAQSTNGVTVTINTIIIKNTNGDIVYQAAPTGGTVQLPSTDALTPVSASSITGVTPGNSYTVTIVTAKGGSFVSSSVVAG